MARGAALWRRFMRGLRKVARYLRETVTPTGWILGIFTFFGLLLGGLYGWIELLVTGIVAGILLILAIPFLFGVKKYGVVLDLSRDRVTVGDNLESTLTVSNQTIRPLMPGHLEIAVGAGQLQVAIPPLGPTSTWTHELSLQTSRRSIINFGPPSVQRGDPLGILRREHAWGKPHTVYIRPPIVPLPATTTGYLRDLEGHPMPQLVSDDLAFHAIREYAPGDALRQVHWKSTAKAGKLMVRQYEVTRRSQMLVILGNRAEEYADPAEFELAVAVAASIGARGLEDGRGLQMVLGGELPPMAPIGMRRVADLPTINRGVMLDSLAGIEMYEQVNSIGEIVETAAEHNHGASLAVLIVGSNLTAPQIRAAVLALPAGTGALVVQCDQLAAPNFRQLQETEVITVAILEDLRRLLGRRATV